MCSDLSFALRNKKRHSNCLWRLGLVCIIYSRKSGNYSHANGFQLMTSARGAVVESGQDEVDCLSHSIILIKWQSAVMRCSRPDTHYSRSMEWHMASDLDTSSLHKSEHFTNLEMPKMKTKNRLLNFSHSTIQKACDEINWMFTRVIKNNCNQMLLTPRLRPVSAWSKKKVRKSNNDDWQLIKGEMWERD